MSLNGALSNAMTGLNSTARKASLVSSNLSNALTEGYGRRELAVSGYGQGYSGGVRVDGVVRHSDPIILSDRRLADAGAAGADTLSDFSQAAERLIGIPGEAGALSSKMADLEASLINAATTPDSAQRLEDVAFRARDVANALNTASSGVQTLRERADRAIATQVNQLNDSLNLVVDLNAKIALSNANGRDPSALMDQRQVVIDGINQIAPVRVVPRDRGAVGLYTTGGAILLDGGAVEIGFTPSNVIAPHMTADNNLLSGLTLNGIPMNTNPETSPLRGGALMANFDIRDNQTVTLQSQLDIVAADLIDRFGDAGPDTTIAPGDPGLFTDQGLAYNGADLTGISGRIELNGIVAPGTGGSWRLRDGLGAATPGFVGDAALLQGMSDAMNARRAPSGTALGAGDRTTSGLVGDLHSAVGAMRLRTDQGQALGQAQLASLRELELAGGVDSDQELQMLLQLEKSYAANAQVIQTVDEMLSTLLRI